MKKWSEEEIRFLINNYSQHGLNYCVENLGRSSSSIRMKTSRLQLKSSLVGTHNIVSNTNYITKLNDTNYEALEPYQRSHIKIKHKHIPCGYVWEVSPNNLEKLVGCPNCSETGFKAVQETYLYLIYFEALQIYKIGITVNWEKRKYSFGYTPILLDLKKFSTGVEARIAEQGILKGLADFLYDSNELNSGNKETFLWP